VHAQQLADVLMDIEDVPTMARFRKLPTKIHSRPRTTIPLRKVSAGTTRLLEELRPLAKSGLALAKVGDDMPRAWVMFEETEQPEFATLIW
jgi:hypothetical protein